MLLGVVILNIFVKVWSLGLCHINNGAQWEAVHGVSKGASLHFGLNNLILHSNVIHICIFDTFSMN